MSRLLAATRAQLALWPVWAIRAFALLPACLHACCLQLVVCDSPAGRLGLTVCYDLRFPEVYQALAWGLGANVLLVPSAFTKVTGMRRLAAC